MASPTTRRTLLTRLCERGDDDAWREFDARYAELVLRYCRRRGLAAADAEDVRQAVFASLSRALPGFRYDPERGRFRSYLGRAVDRAVARHRRRNPTRVRLPSAVLEELSAPPAQDGLWEQEWMDHHLRLAMKHVRRGLEPRTVAAFDALLSGVEFQRVAREHDLSHAALHKIKQRVRDRLRARVAQQLSDEEGGPP